MDALEQVQVGGATLRVCCQPGVDRRSTRLGVHEGVYQLESCQGGTFAAPQRLPDVRVLGLRDALDDLLADEDIHERDLLLCGHQATP